MPHDRVFISYSSTDEAFLQAFLVHLKPWQDRNLLEVWSDRDIETSEDWHHTMNGTPPKQKRTLLSMVSVSPKRLPFSRMISL